MTDLTKPREHWGTRIGVILAVTGSAVGLGNFLRFPGKAATYGGGAFMIPYIAAFLLLGLPIAWVEWTMGRMGGTRGHNSTPGIFRVLWKSKISPYFGALAMLVPVAIYMYYVLIEAWCLGYAWYYATGTMAEIGRQGNASSFIATFAGLGGHGEAYSRWEYSTLPFLLICFVLNFVLIYRGLTKGIEFFCRWAMPALVLCALVVLVRVLTLPNIWDGLGYMWNPRMPGKTFAETLLDGRIWLEASGQIFFSLSVGFGIVITYSSYLRRDDDVALSAATAVAGNGFVEVVLGGLITIPAAFVLLGISGIEAAGDSTFKIGFMTLPGVFERMVGGQFFGALFFFLLFLAAVTSSLSMLQPAIAFLEEGLGLGRKASVTLLGFITLIGAGFVSYFSGDLVALDTIDFWVGSFCIFVLAGFQVFLFAWVIGVDAGFNELDRGAEIRVPRFMKFIIKYVSPTFLAIVFVLWVRQEVFVGGYGKALLDNLYAQIAVGFVLVLLIMFILLIGQAVKRWRLREQQQTEVSP